MSCLIFIIASQQNFRILSFKIRNNCLSFLLCFILSMIRACLLAYLIFVVFPDIIFFNISTWSLNSNNWWVQKTEPFFTNESIFNAFICWLVWSYLIFVLQILFYIYLPLLFFVGVFWLIKYIARTNFGSVCKGFCLFFYYMFCYIKIIIIGEVFDLYMGLLLGRAANFINDFEIPGN